MFLARQVAITTRKIQSKQQLHHFNNIIRRNLSSNQEIHTVLDPNYSNIPKNISSKLQTNLHLKPNHPLSLIKTHIEEYWKATAKSTQYSNKVKCYDDLSPIVPIYSNFDSLNIPFDHVSRSKSDTYYCNKEYVLRTHTSAHQVELLKNGEDFFLVTGDVYRRDEIDSCHYPVFHQMEGVKIFKNENEEMTKYIEHDLKQSLEGMAKFIFGNVEMRWIDAYFPFTNPSYELEIFFHNEWLEVLGCGVIHPKILQNANRNPNKESGWAFGLGLERLAMVLFSIPDIRLFWTEDDRFHNQFKNGTLNVTFEEYSKYPPCTKDISFWITDDFHLNDLYEVIRGIGGDLIEHVTLIDEFVHPKTMRKSLCFRISYRSMDRSLKNEEIDILQEMVRRDLVSQLGVVLR